MAALFNATMVSLIGRAASGGAVAPPLLPPFYSFVGRFLPNGATIQMIRNAVYFTDHQHLEPMLVQAGWLLACLTALMLVHRVWHRTPGSG